MKIRLALNGMAILVCLFVGFTFAVFTDTFKNGRWDGQVSLVAAICSFSLAYWLAHRHSTLKKVV